MGCRAIGDVRWWVDELSEVCGETLVTDDNSGTGSYPDGPKGRQRNSRRTVNQMPRPAP